MKGSQNLLALAIGVSTLAKLAFINLEFDTAAHPAGRALISATAALLLLCAAFLQFLRPSRRIFAALVLDACISLLAVVDLVHWRFVGDVTSLSEVSQLWQLGSIAASIPDFVRLSDLLLFLDVGVAWLIWSRLEADCGERPDRRWKLPKFAAMVASALVVGTPALRLMANDPDEVFEYSTTRREVAVAIGLMPYHLYDLSVQLRFPWAGRLMVSADQRQEALDVIATLGRDAGKSRFNGIARNRNVVLIMCESLHAFPIGLTVENQEVAPNLTAFARESLHFVNAFDQTHMGTTSDGEFTSLQSLHPLPTSAVSTRFGANEFFALPAILAAHGYDTLSAGAESSDFWNKQQMHPKYGFRESFFGKAFRPGESFGLGLSDGEFFEQIEPVIKARRAPFMAFLITLSNHHPYVIPPDRRTLSLSPPLGRTLVGSYLQSVHYFDNVFGRFIGRLRDIGLLDQSVVVVYGDHQAFWSDQPSLGPVLRIPAGDHARVWKARKTLTLLIHLPGGEGAGDLQAATGQLDIAPTLLGLLGIDRRGEVMMGRDLTGPADPLVVLRTGSFITKQSISIDDGEARGCYALSTGEPGECPSSEIRARARQRLRVSDTIIRANLVPWIRSQSSTGRLAAEEAK